MARDLKEAVKMFKAIKEDLPNFYDDVLKEVGARFLSLVIPLTPVEENYTYEDRGKVVKVSGGALRRGWIGEVEPGPTPTQAEIEKYIRELRTGGQRITLANTSEYAIYVNYGHLQSPGRYVPAIGKRLTKSWVDGLKFKEMAENEIGPYLPKVYNQKLKEYYKKWSKK